MWVEKSLQQTCTSWIYTIVDLITILIIILLRICYIVIKKPICHLTIQSYQTLQSTSQWIK